MKLRNEAHDEVQWVIRKIQKNFYLSQKGNFILFEIDDKTKDKSTPPYYDQIGILDKLEKAETIRIHKKEFKKHLSNNEDKEKVNLFYIEILQPNFDNFYGEFDSSAEKTGVITSAEPEAEAGNLAFFNDGTLRYKGEILKIRPQLKYLCKIFIENTNKLITLDTIKDEIIKADRRHTISYTTISKYVSELHNSLKIHFGKKVIFNHKEEGWHFKP